MGDKCKQNDDFFIRHYTDSDSSENSSKVGSIAENNDFDRDSFDKHSTGNGLRNYAMENMECLSCELESESCHGCSDGVSRKCEPFSKPFSIWTDAAGK